MRATNRTMMMPHCRAISPERDDNDQRCIQKVMKDFLNAVSIEFNSNPRHREHSDAN
jgi:hypothetical protein